MTAINELRRKVIALEEERDRLNNSIGMAFGDELTEMNRQLDDVVRQLAEIYREYERLAPPDPYGRDVIAKSYRVAWEIDVEATSPEEASRQAFEIMRRTDTTATVFSVKDGAGGETTVDLMEADDRGRAIDR